MVKFKLNGGKKIELSAFINTGISFETANLSRMDLNSERTENIKT